MIKVGTHWKSSTWN